MTTITCRACRSTVEVPPPAPVVPQPTPPVGKVLCDSCRTEMGNHAKVLEWAQWRDQVHA